MKSVFNYDGPFFSGLSRLADLLWLNVLFIVCSLPVFTIGASASALYYVTLKMARDEEGYITKSFFKSFKQNFLQGTAIWLILLAIGAVIAFDFRFVTNEMYASMIPGDTIRNVVLIATMAIGFIWLFVCVYVFAVLAKFDNTVKNTIRNAFFMSIRHLPQTILLVVILITPLVLMYFFNIAILLVFVMFSVEAYWSSKLLVKIFDLYLPKECNEEDLVPEGINEEKED